MNVLITKWTEILGSIYASIWGRPHLSEIDGKTFKEAASKHSDDPKIQMVNDDDKIIIEWEPVVTVIRKI